MFGQLLPNKNKITTVPGALFMPEFWPEFRHLNRPSANVRKKLASYIHPTIACDPIQFFSGQDMVNNICGTKHSLS
jgi:hypothetical protein